MIRYFLPCLLLLLQNNAGFANKIDELQTPEQVLKFIKRTFDKSDRFQVKPRPATAIDFKYIKLDINGDGLTDILINGIYLYAIIDKGGRNNFEENYIGCRHFNCGLLSVDSSGKLPLFIVQKDNDYDNETGNDIIFSPDTLVNKFGGFVEYNAHPAAIDFKQLTIGTAPCFGTCAIFTFNINGRRQATLNAIQYNRLSGIYRAEIDEPVFDNLVALLAYLNIDGLKDRYAIGWTDNPSIDTEIQYNSTTKKIHDYGLEGSFGLKRLYEILFALKATLVWDQ